MRVEVGANLVDKERYLWKGWSHMGGGGGIIGSQGT